MVGNLRLEDDRSSPSLTNCRGPAAKVFNDILRDLMKPDAQTMWAARRALFEGAAPTLERIATACGASHKTMTEIASTDGWRQANASGSAGSILAMVQTVKEKLLETIEKKRKGRAGGTQGLDAVAIADLTAIARTLDKLGEDTREGAKENQVKNDHDIAGLLDRLDRKIIELATYLAAEMAAGKSE